MAKRKREPMYDIFELVLLYNLLADQIGYRLTRGLASYYGTQDLEKEMLKDAPKELRPHLRKIISGMRGLDKASEEIMKANPREGLADPAREQQEGSRYKNAFLEGSLSNDLVNGALSDGSAEKIKALMDLLPSCYDEFRLRDYLYQLEHPKEVEK